eukprot:COSAG04_NODE_29091_length_271_cov_0.656977_1_plen_48_part_01
MWILPNEAKVSLHWAQVRRLGRGMTCQQRYRWHLEKNAIQMPAISWQL